MNLDTPLAELDGISPQRLRLLHKFGMRRAGDLLTHYPRRYEDRRKFDHFPDGESDNPVCVCGNVVKTTIKRLPGWKKLFEARLEEVNPNAMSPEITCRWFNLHFVEKMIATGQRLVVYGKPKLRGKKICIDHPEFEIVENDEEISIHLKRITPIYRATEGLSQRVLRSLIHDLLQRIPDSELPGRLPEQLDPCPFAAALHEIHFPSEWDELAKARRHLVLTEFFTLQLFIAAKREEVVSHRGEPHCGPGHLVEALHKALPFPLTGAQVRAIEEIRADLASSHPMNRLLHGDVGSGKTLVALSAMLLCVESGYQAALMAPTQILAEQHYLNFKRLLEPSGVRLALRTGAREEDSAPLPLFEQANGPGGTGGPPVVSGGPPETLTATPRQSAARYWHRNLPHFERPWAKYAITFNTIDGRILSPEARHIVLDCILHWKDRRYALYAACVMPDHVHLLIEPSVKENDENGGVIFFPLTEILHTIKSFTAHEINKLEKRKGPLWQDERFDRYIRSDADLEEKFGYICSNPWENGVVREGEDYPWVWYAGKDQGGLVHDGSGAGRPGQRASGPFHPAAMHGGDPQIIVGTHALLYEGMPFSRLGLVVIDEQHKFGVLQRARLISQAVAPDVLVMTATPIPRTLAITLYGDLDVSTLDEMPANRGKIITVSREKSKLPEAVKFVREHLEAGRQAFIVYPIIDESEKLEVKAAASEFERWREFLEPMRCELLHGRIPPEEKDAIMSRFRQNETQALIATSVIEVGIDVPNANIMLIENAERFGLAQLHQLRGRIGRGEHKSYCILICEAKNEEAINKLKILERTSDGFEIAEADLQLRGPGDILGTAQSGLPPLKLGNLLEDAELMRLARKAAREVFAADPRLERDENKHFRDLIVEGKKLTLSQVS